MRDLAGLLKVLKTLIDSLFGTEYHHRPNHKLE